MRVVAAGLIGVAVATGECAGGRCDVEDAMLLQAQVQQHHAEAAHVDMTDLASPGLEEVSVSVEPKAISTVTAFGPYFNYAVGLQVRGRVMIEGQGVGMYAQQILSWNLNGVDPLCKRVPENVSGACAIHIHVGTSCYTDALGHYHATSPDPWHQITYKVGTCPITHGHRCASAHGVHVVTGLTNSEVLGHTMVVHDHTGARVACGIITPSHVGVNSFARYFNYIGSLSVSGRIGVSSFGVLDSAGQDLKWELHGVDAKCKWGGSSQYKNSCGIHIHTGTDCVSNAEGHFFNETTFVQDPWANIDYHSIAWWKHPSGISAQSSGKDVTTGFETTTMMGHALIVHDFEGVRVACGIISPFEVVANAFIPYVNYSGSLKVSGWVSALGDGVNLKASQTLSWKLKGADPRCKTPPRSDANPGSCEIHIHTGVSCSEVAGGHYFDENVGMDPWTRVKYLSCSTGATTCAGVVVVTGLSNWNVTGHAVIVHDATGAKVACGILSTAV